MPTKHNLKFIPFLRFLMVSSKFYYRFYFRKKFYWSFVLNQYQHHSNTECSYAVSNPVCRHRITIAKLKCG